MIETFKTKYGSKYILKDEDIIKMFDIINSQKEENEKAYLLYTLCDYDTLKINCDRAKRFNLDKTDKLLQLLKIYQLYSEKGYFVLAKNSYKCTLKEAIDRLNKINLALEIVNSNIKDYQKADKLYNLYPSAEQFRKSYSLFIRNGKKDDRLNFAREAIDNFDVIYNKYMEYESNGIFDNIRYFYNVKSFIENYEYAKFAINHYINFSNSYKTKEFLALLGIDEETFNFCVRTVEELDVDLYNMYLECKEQNNKIRCFKNLTTISNLATGIRTGVLVDGTKFDLLEFIKRVPFKNSHNFYYVINNFMLRNNFSDCQIILNYIYNNQLHLPNVFKPLNVSSLYNIKTIINGKELTREDIDIIVEYMNQNNIPLIRKTYGIIRKMYLNDEINVDTVKENAIKSKDKSEKVKSVFLIPSSNKK